VELAFEDHGRGMSETELDTLFQEFEQVLDDEENQAAGLFEGREEHRGDPVSLGLGLAITARFVRLNCGQIAISSELGKGTQVSIKIPLKIRSTDDLLGQDTLSEDSLPTLPTLPTPPLLTPDTTNPVVHLSSHPRVLERSVSVETTLPNRRKSEISQSRHASSTRGAEVLGTMARTVAYSTAPTFDPLTGRGPFPPTAQIRVRVLVAEDNPLNSKLLEARLTKRGHEVKVTGDGQACFEIFKEGTEAYDVILMDIQVCISSIDDQEQNQPLNQCRCHSLME
jgi:CheY-like chemotaxis protein